MPRRGNGLLFELLVKMSRCASNAAPLQIPNRFGADFTHRNRSNLTVSAENRVRPHRGRAWPEFEARNNMMESQGWRGPSPQKETGE
jgi:hypothetical protein